MGAWAAVAVLGILLALDIAIIAREHPKLSSREFFVYTAIAVLLSLAVLLALGIGGGLVKLSLP